MLYAHSIEFFQIYDIDDGRMNPFEREIISVGFVVIDENYNIKKKYTSYVKPIHRPILTDYCKELTGISQEDVDHAKKSNDVFRDINALCGKYSIDYVFAFGNFDEEIIKVTAKWNRKANERTSKLYPMLKKITDVRPAILKAIGKSQRRSPGLRKIAEELGVKVKDEKHDALGDAMLLYRVCRKLNIQMI